MVSNSNLRGRPPKPRSEDGISGKPPSVPNESLRSFINGFLETGGPVRTVSALARAAGINTSMITMAFAGHRPLSMASAMAIAKVLVSGKSGEEIPVLARKLFSAGKPEGALNEGNLFSSVADRVRFGGKVRVGYVISEPFLIESVSRPEGFAVDIFDRLSGLMKLDVGKWDKLDFQDIETALRSRRVDIVVSAVLQTFKRREFMSFTRPIPYIALPLSGIVRKTFNENFRSKTGRPFDAESLLNPREDAAAASEARLLLVKGEVGEEFYDAFLRSPLKGMSAPTEIPGSLAPENLAKALEDHKADLLIADVGTCRSVLRHAEDHFDSLKEVAEATSGASITLDTVSFARLAQYRVVFGLPKFDREWKAMVDDAFECLLSEGLRSLVSLYRRSRPGQPNGLEPFLLGEDDSVESTVARAWFESVPEIMDKRHRKDNLDAGHESP